MRYEKHRHLWLPRRREFLGMCVAGGVGSMFPRLALAVPLANINLNFTGEFVFGEPTPLSIPDGATNITLRVDRCTSSSLSTWSDPSTTFNINTEVSVDGGLSWQEWLGFGAEGGIDIDMDGNESPESNLTCPLPEGTGRLLRGVAHSSGPRMRSKLAVEVL